jgi:hypothetical protein
MKAMKNEKNFVSSVSCNLRSLPKDFLLGDR